MTDETAAAANGVAFLVYGAIALIVALALGPARHWRANRLATAAVVIFGACALGHAAHAALHAHAAVTGEAHGTAGTTGTVLNLVSTAVDVVTAAAGLWYWSLRSRFPALVRGAQVYEDLRLRQAAERRLRLSEQRYRGIVETTSEGVVLVDPHGVVEYSNAQFARLVGRTTRELRGTVFADLVLPAYREDVLTALAQVRSGTRRLEVEIASAEASRAGRPATIHAQIALTARADTEAGPTGEGAGTAAPAGALAMVADVTERRSVEAQLRQAQRLDAVGQLAGGVAHDFNNLLTVIDGYAAILLADVDGPSRRDVTAIRDAAARAAALTRQLLAFSRTQAIQPQAVDVNELVVGIEGMLSRLIREDIQIVVRADAERATVWADRGQLEQVLINLAVNSRDAMPDGGQLTIRTARARPPGYALDAGGEGTCAEHVLLTVSDTGCGIPDDVRPMIFEPFFTTKEPGHGTGLGLSTVYGIVRQAGGQVLVDSTPGVGTEVRVYLPATSTPARPSSASRDAGQLAGGRGTILLVEDDDEVRRLSERILLAAGYDVLAAGDGRRALDLAAGVAGLDLLITDVVMPRMNGRQLADRLQAGHPGLPVLYLSAYHRGVLNPPVGPTPGVGYLEKPYSPTLLTETVSELLLAARAARRAGGPRPPAPRAAAPGGPPKAVGAWRPKGAGPFGPANPAGSATGNWHPGTAPTGPTTGPIVINGASPLPDTPSLN